MASTLLEQTRESHEESERLERCIVRDLKTAAISHKQRLRQGHRVNRALDTMVETTKRLRASYKDDDHALREEIAGFGGMGKGPIELNDDDKNEEAKSAKNVKARQSTAFSSFYDRLAEIRTYHEHQPGMFAPSSSAFVELFKNDVPIPFSGEESNGRYLDLHDAHSIYHNASFGRKDIGYVAFLAELGQTQLSSISRSKKFSESYKEYLTQLRTYLASFVSKTQPLSFAKIDESISSSEKASDSSDSFDKKWTEGTVVGWEDRGVGSGDSAGSDGSIGAVLDEIQICGSVSDITKRFPDPEDIKQKLKTLGLKQGGTEQQRAERLFSVKGVKSSTYPEGVDKKLLAKGFLVTKTDPKKAEAKAKNIAQLEHEITEFLSQQLKLTLDNTKAMIEKKQTLTAAELEADALEDSDFVESEDEDDGNDYINNPLKLPLGFDGKPIPYWLYKLHGLNVQFTCEICGNYSYWGRRAYEKHFKEQRHQHGMRCLKIPNTKAFAEVREVFFLATFSAQSLLD